jgi:hypothetical protein
MKNNKSSNKPRTMLDQEVGSMQDKKTNEDFNNEHPDHDDAGLTKGNSNKDEKSSTKILKLKNI